MHTMNIIYFKVGVQVNPPEPPLRTGLNVFLKLPPLKLTTQSSEATSKIIQRARHPIGDAEVSTDRELPDDVLNVGGDDAAVIEPSHHEIEAKSSINGWSNIRNRLLTAFMESEHLPDGQVCISFVLVALRLAVLWLWTTHLIVGNVSAVNTTGSCCIEMGGKNIRYVKLSVTWI